MVKTLMSQAEIRARDQGYTLFELLVVLAIVSVAVSLVPNIYARLVPTYEARQFTNEIVNRLRSLREDAKRERLVHSLSIDPDDKSIVISKGVLVPPAGVSLEYADEGAVEADPAGRIYFYPNGTTTGGTIAVSRDEYVAQVKVDWVTSAIGLIE